MKPDRSIYPEPVLNQLEYLERRIMEVRKHRRTMLSAHYREIISKLPPVDVNIWGADPCMLTLTTFVTAFTFEDAPELFSHLETLTELFGFPESEDCPEDSYRQYSFGQYNPWRVTLRAHLKDDGTCKRVLVGMREETVYKEVTVDKPIYAFSCA
jgi:hypothetical protein